MRPDTTLLIAVARLTPTRLARLLSEFALHLGMQTTDTLALRMPFKLPLLLCWPLSWLLCRFDCSSPA
jgi:hypothetical protein